MVAGGNWQIFEEIIDPRAVRQQNSLSCGAACGEMLLKERGIDRVNQQIIARQSGVPVDVVTLGEVLNSFTFSNEGEWQGRGFIYGSSYENAIDWLTVRGVWAAELREIGKGIAHLVVVDGFDEQGRLRIRDPWEGTSYKMDKGELVNYWTLRGIRWVQK